MAVMGTKAQIGREELPPFVIDAPMMVDGQPCTSCWQQVLGPTAHGETEGDQACDTSCFRQLGLPARFAPVID